MLWFVAEDKRYYNDNEVISKLQEKYNFSDWILLPQNEDIKRAVANDIPIIAPYLPPKNLRSMCVIKYLPNFENVRTTQEKEHNVTEEEALENRLGLNVINSPYTFADMAGSERLVEWTNKLLKAEKKGYRAKGVFLVGIPGTGKTFFPKCFAGHTKRLLVMLNIPLIMEADEPMAKLNAIFEYLSLKYRQDPNTKYIILIDEIEKMIGNNEPIEKRILGRLLTVLNDVGTSASEYNFNAIFFATANNLNSILDNNPELLRRGRWDELFFINCPTEENALEMFKLYLKAFELEELLKHIDLKDLVSQISNILDKVKSDRKRFPYTASEIESFCKTIQFNVKAGTFNSKNFIKEYCELIIPISKSATAAIERMIAQKELFVEI